MRTAVLALVSTLALGACNPSAPQGAGGDAGVAVDAGSGLFPNLFQTAYRAEGTMANPESGQVMPVVMIRDGRKMRMEMTAPQGRTIIINNPDTGETLMIASAGGRTTAMRMSAADRSNPAEDWQEEMSTATLTGPCSGAGQSGSQWARTEGAAMSTVCVTGDGIVLKATDGGQTTWETTSVQRGPQSADLFALPPGVQVMDLGNMGAAMNEAMERAKAGGQ